MLPAAADAVAALFDAKASFAGPSALKLLLSVLGVLRRGAAVSLASLTARGALCSSCKKLHFSPYGQFPSPKYFLHGRVL